MAETRSGDTTHQVRFMCTSGDPLGKKAFFKAKCISLIMTEKWLTIVKRIATKELQSSKNCADSETNYLADR